MSTVPWLYLDHATSTPLSPGVREAMEPWWNEPSLAAGLHRGSLAVRDALNDARQTFREWFRMRSDDEIIFTSSGTEAVNLAILGGARARGHRGRHLITSTIEHPASAAAVAVLETEGFSVTRIPCDSFGRLDPQAYVAAFRDETVLALTHLANYDIGTIQPVAQIAAHGQARGVPVFCDACHAAGWVDVPAGISLLSLSPHRWGGPKGVGVLVRDRAVQLKPLLVGGVQESGLRAGTENLPAIVGASVAARYFLDDREHRMEKARSVQIRVLEGLRSVIPDLYLNGPEPGPDRHPINLNLSLPNAEGESIALLADLQGLGLGAGTSCASQALRVSPVLKAIGRAHRLALGTVLLGASPEISESEIQRVLETLPRIVKKIQGMNGVGTTSGS